MANVAKIYISEKQIKKRHFDKAAGKYMGYDHTSQKDNDGNPIQMVHVLLPSASHREFQFQPDSNGIDRNSREAYIQVPLAAIKDTKEKRRKVLYLSCPYSTFTVYFKGERNRDRDSENFGKFDNPEKIRLGIKDVQKIWPTSLKSKKVVKTAEKETTQNTVENSINTPKKEASKEKGV